MENVFPDTLDKKNRCKDCKSYRKLMIDKDEFPMCFKFNMKVDPNKEACDEYE